MAITAPDLHHATVMLIIMFATIMLHVKGQDVVALPLLQEADTPVNPEPYSSSSSLMPPDTATSALHTANTPAAASAVATAADSTGSPNGSSSDHWPHDATSHTNDLTAATDVTAAALPAELPKDQKDLSLEVILHLGFKANNQLDYGGRHITIATFKGKRDKTSNHRAMTRGSIARWINATSRCDLNLLDFQKKTSWRLNTTSCTNQKATSCSCIGHYDHTKKELQCGKYPWPTPSGYSNRTYTIVLKSRHLNDLGRCMVALQNRLDNNRTLQDAALKNFGIEEMSAKGPSSTSGTPWHVMLYRAYTYPPAKTQYDQLVNSTSAWRVYWNEYQFKKGDKLPAPCPDPAVNATTPAGNPGKYDKGSGDFVAPFCWQWTLYS